MAVLLAGCGLKPAGHVVEAVPDTAVTLKVVDMTSLLDMADCSLEDARTGDDTVALRLVEAVAEPDFREAFLRVASVRGGADLSRVTGFTDGDGHRFMALPVAAHEVLTEALTEACGPAEVASDGETEYFDCGCCVVSVDGMFCRIGQSRSELDKVCAEAARGHLGALSGVRGFIDSRGVAKVAVRCGGSPLSFLGDDSRWLCVAMNATAVSVTAEAVVMDGEGQLDSLGRHFEVIDTAFLRYTPQNAAVKLAFGKFDGNEHGLAMLLGRYAPVYLSQADGTTSLYAVPAGGVDAVAAGEAGAWNVGTMISLPPELRTRAIDQYKERAGKNLRWIGSQWEYSEGDSRYYFGEFDGSVAFSSNREIGVLYNNVYDDDFTGMRAAMVVDIPVGSTLAKAWRIPYGLTFKLTVDAMKVKGRIVFHGTNENALVSLLRLPQLPDFRERFRAHAGM